MKIKSKPAVKTVTATKTRTTVKKAAPKAAKSGEKSVTFTVHAEAGKSVYLAGSFNNWDPQATKMVDKSGDGIYTVKEIYKDTVLVDGNHPFAGKDLIFEVEVVSIDAPSFTELESGFPDEEDNFDDDNYDSRYDGDYGENENRRWH